MKRLLVSFCFALTLTFAQEHAAPAAEHGAAEGHGEAHHEDPLAMWKWINFGILAALLGFAVIKFGVPALNGRAADIVSDLEESKKIRAEAEARAAAIEARISNLGGEVNALRENAKKEMEAEGARIQDETRRTIAKMQENVGREIESMTKQAENEMRAFTAQLALKLAEEKVKARMSPETQGELVHRFVAGLRDRGLSN